MSPRPVTDTPSSAPSASASPSPNDHAPASAAMEKWLPAYVVILVLFALSLLCSVVLIIFLFRKHRPSSDSAARPPRRSGGVVTAPYGPPQYMRHGGNEPFELQALRGGAQDRPANATHDDTSTGSSSSRPGGNETDGNKQRPTPASGGVQTPPPPRRSLPATGYNCHRHPARPSLHEILSRPSDDQDDHGRRRYPPGVNPYTMEITRRAPSPSSPRASCRSSSDAAAALLAEGGGVAGVNKPAPPAVAAAAAAATFVPPSPAVTDCCWKDGEEQDAKPSRGTRRKGGWISRRRSSMRRLGGESTRERVRKFVKGEYTRSHQRGSKVERGEQTSKQIIIA
ncbi:uncharacterized protein E0L32_008152 [Thyridium curvatum]|uniref:Uncharacterized protein n=1 Tax=Thyridium curvatum TaxID=1093900 RepID=A0A507AW32_9PEZI|nr:uncharacterized protein E0L32_008152 [Thyridium curvatum]TPX10946.1 hypothetical protein E0L32_008152 [Thyridium curvatum]